MGLDTSFDCWHGPYSQFHRWRIWLAEQIGLPLGLMESFVEFVPEQIEVDLSDWTKLGCKDNWKSYKCIHDVVWAASHGVPIKWSLINDPLVALLHHSDCDGRIRWWDAGRIAIRLGQLLRTIEKDSTDSTTERGCYDGMYAATKRFALGCARAYRARKDIRFA